MKMDVKKENHKDGKTERNERKIKEKHGKRI
jgi:hypothetical protein